MNVGFVGYSSSKFDVVKATNIILKIFIDLKKIKKPIKIVSGATNLGIPGLTYEIAGMLGYETIGYMCEKGYEYELFNVDKLHVIGNNWGDESEDFLNDIDVLYRIGGGKQSIAECGKAKEKGIKVIEYDL